MPTFLGFSAAAIGMSTEILRSHKVQLNRFDILHNMPFDPDGSLSFKLQDVEYKHIAVKDVTFNTDVDYYFGVNNPGSKFGVFEWFSKNYGLTRQMISNGVHLNTSIARSCQLDHGVMINPGVVIAPFAHLGFGVTINRMVSIGHHTKIHSFVSIQPGANIAGRVTIGEKVSIGMGANVIDGVTIGANSIIGAGSLVTKDIPENVVAYGVPCRVVKTTDT